MNSDLVAEPVNIGNNGEATILEWAKMVLDVTEEVQAELLPPAERKPRSQIVHLPLPADDVRRRCLALNPAAASPKARHDQSARTARLHRELPGRGRHQRDRPVFSLMFDDLELYNSFNPPARAPAPIPRRRRAVQ